MFTTLAVPYYLSRNRPPGKRVGAVLRFIGFLALAPVLLVAAALPFLLS